jgi:glutathione reductase (NADPH)
LRGFDEDVRRTLGEEMGKKGVNLLLQRTVERIDAIDLPARRDADRRELRVSLDDGQVLSADQVMYATGRVPNVRDVGIENSGVTLHASGWIFVDEYSRTSVPHIYAVGDVTNRINLTPVAINEAHAFADSVFGGQDRPVSHEFVPSAVFSQPPVGTVGHTERAARQHCGAIDVYLQNFRPLKHTLSGRNERTLMKLIVARDTQRVVGIHIVGLDAPEIVQGFAVAVKSGLTKDQFDATMGIHPTAAEELVTMRASHKTPGESDCQG